MVDNYLSNYNVKSNFVTSVLFACPYCETVQNLTSKKHFFYCCACCNVWRVDISGNIERHIYGPISQQKAMKSDKRFLTISQWIKWQEKFLQNYIQLKMQLSHEAIIFYDKYVSFNKKKRILKNGSIELTYKYFTVKIGHEFSQSQKIISFPIQDINNIILQNTTMSWKTTSEEIYKITLKKADNVYKYCKAISFLSHKYLNECSA